MDESKKMTIDEQIAKAQARVAELRARKSKTERRDRNGELVALGIIIENQFTSAPDVVKTWLTKAARSQSEERTRQRALAAIERLNVNPLVDDDGDKQDDHSGNIIYLNVPFEEKDKAKELGAKFDSKSKKWFIMKNEFDSDNFSRWI